MSDVKPIPEGFNTVSVYLIVPNSKEALKFYEKAFGCQTVLLLNGPGDSTMHAEMRIGNSTIMLTDENPEWKQSSPSTLGGTPVGLHIYVEDADSLYEQAVSAGCTPIMPMSDAFWGDRFGKVSDPYGHEWSFATHKEDLSEAEVEERSKAFFEQMAKGEGC